MQMADSLKRLLSNQRDILNSLKKLKRENGINFELDPETNARNEKYNR